MTNHLAQRRWHGPRSRAAALAALLLAALTLVLLSGCGGADDASNQTPDSAAPATGSGDGDEDAGRERLRQCLRDNGVELPADAGQGDTPPRDVNLSEVQELLEGECEEFASGAFGNASPERQQEFQDAFAVFAQCMRDQGVEVPDLTASGGAPPDPGSIDLSDPKVQAAQEACQSKLPQPLPGGGG